MELEEFKVVRVMKEMKVGMKMKMPPVIEMTIHPLKMMEMKHAPPDDLIIFPPPPPNNYLKSIPPQLLISLLHLAQKVSKS